MAGVSAPMPMPHSRWNELPAAALRAAGYTLLSWSDETGADAFVREEQSLLLFFRGIPSTRTRRSSRNTAATSGAI